MGRSTLINGLVATGAGVISNKLVAATNNFIAPFVASAILLMLAWIVIRGTWAENYGSGGGVVDHDVFQVKRLGRAWDIVRRGMSHSNLCFFLILLTSWFYRSPSSRTWTYTNVL
jgi:MFS transporter, MFS domain-containing protein family, molybdate-anion transporter